MGRPAKYATAKEAAEGYLYSKMGGGSTLSLQEYIDIATCKCTLCGVDPSEEMPVKRADGDYTLKFNRVVMIDNKPTTLCVQCKALTAVSQDAKSITSLAARLMAKRKWYKDKKWLFT